MMRVRVLLAVFLVGAAACSNTPITPTTPTTPNTFTEVFTGTVNMNGGASHFFVSQKSGTVIVALTSLAPDATQLVGLSLGTWTGAACQVVIANDKATSSSALTGAVGGAGSLCARVYDIGSITAGSPVSYEITITHP